MIKRKIYLIRHEIASFFLGLIVGLLLWAIIWSGKKDSIVDFFTSIGALATACSVIYLLYDNRRIRNESKEAKERQDLRDERQNEVWNLQQETVKFQRLESHKQLFFSLLEQLQESHDRRFVFARPQLLYRELFPKNGITNCEFTIKETNNSGKHRSVIFDCWECYKDMLNSLDEVDECGMALTSPDEYADIYDISVFLTRVNTLRKCLQINFQDNGALGGVYDDHNENCQIIVNAFHPLDNCKILGDVFINICDFVSYKEPELIGHHSVSGLRKAMLYYSLHPDRWGPWRSNWKGLKKEIYSIYASDLMLLKYSKHSGGTGLSQLFIDKSILENSINDKNELIIMLNKTLRALEFEVNCCSAVTRYPGFQRLYDEINEYISLHTKGT